ncbi:DUF6265 family protein [Sediminibacterium sp.]|uniref:DUF6265 family protein n=1 Tax=Sediminibacterium sp. TaxID=1917865 RepID=UPI003F6F3A96
MYKKTVLAIFSVIIFCSWSLQPKNEIKNAEWLIGTWENKTPNGSIYETWAKVSDVELSGKSYMLKEKDTIVFETIRLIQENNNLFYMPKVKNQNDNMPVRFKAKTASNNELIFENPNHDFPQIIAYSKINANALVAEIAGTKNGKERKQIFPMSRVK